MRKLMLRFLYAVSHYPHKDVHNSALLAKAYHTQSRCSWRDDICGRSTWRHQSCITLLTPSIRRIPAGHILKCTLFLFAKSKNFFSLRIILQRNWPLYQCSGKEKLSSGSMPCTVSVLLWMMIQGLINLKGCWLHTYSCEPAVNVMQMTLIAGNKFIVKWNWTSYGGIN